MALITKTLANENNKLRDEITELKKQLEQVRELNFNFLDTLNGQLRAHQISDGAADELAQSLGHYLDTEIEGQVVVRYKVRATVPLGFPVSHLDISELMFFPDPELEDEELGIQFEQMEPEFRLTKGPKGCII
jgi:hypothetical protein